MVVICLLVELHQEGSTPAACAGGWFLWHSQYLVCMSIEIHTISPKQKYTSEFCAQVNVNMFRCIFLCSDPLTHTTTRPSRNKCHLVPPVAYFGGDKSLLIPWYSCHMWKGRQPNITWCQTEVKTSTLTRTLLSESSVRQMFIDKQQLLTDLV